MRVLLAERDKLLRDAVAIALEGLFDATVEAVSTSEAALSFLDKAEDLKLVISSGADTAAIKGFLEKKGRSVPLVSYSEGAAEYAGKGIYELPLPLDLHKLASAITTLLSEKKEPLKLRDGSIFCKVKLETLLFSGQLYQYDVYLKLAEDKYVKVLNKGDAFGVDEYTRYTAKQLKYLYLKEEDFLNFLTAFTHDIDSLLKTKSELVSFESSFEVSQAIHETLLFAIPRFGMQKELENLVRASIHLAVTAMKKNPEISTLVKKKLADKSQFLSWHSTMLTYVSCWVSTLMTWDSETTHYKLALAAYLHDLCLENTKHASYRDLKEFGEGAHSKAEMENFLSHPLRAAELVRGMKDFPGDVDHIVAQHHEQPDGSGFPAGANHTKISPLAALFIISQEIVHSIYDQGKNFTLAQFVKETEQRFQSGYFKKIMQELRKVS